MNIGYEKRAISMKTKLHTLKRVSKCELLKIAIELGMGETIINDCRGTEKFGRILCSNYHIMVLKIFLCFKEMETGNCRCEL